MKNKLYLSMLSVSLLFFACKKIDNIVDVQPSANGTDTHHYTSLKDFYHQNGVPSYFYTFNTSASYSFTTPHGTHVSIPANAFISQSGNPVAGNVTIEFRDIYKKSEMVLSDMTTAMSNGGLLKSAGEFYIKATVNGTAVLLAPGKIINIQQPSATPLDPGMLPFEAAPDTFGNMGWNNAQNGGIDTAAGGQFNGFNGPYFYSYDMYQFNIPADSGSWCNSDNPSYFGGMPQTNFTINVNGTQNLGSGYSDVFLVFSSENSTVHVYQNWMGNGMSFPYSYAPLGLNATVVTIGVYNGQLYASFTPVTIGANQTVNVTPVPMTTAQVATQLEALN